MLVFIFQNRQPCPHRHRYPSLPPSPIPVCVRHMPWQQNQHIHTHTHTKLSTSPPPSLMHTWYSVAPCEEPIPPPTGGPVSSCTHCLHRKSKLPSPQESSLAKRLSWGQVTYFQPTATSIPADCKWGSKIFPILDWGCGLVADNKHIQLDYLCLVCGELEAVGFKVPHTHTCIYLGGGKKGGRSDVYHCWWWGALQGEWICLLFVKRWGVLFPRVIQETGFTDSMPTHAQW